MAYYSFVQNNLGRYVEYSDPRNKFQCVDLMYKYIRDVWGYTNPHAAVPPALYAKNIYTNFQSTAQIKKIPNTPNGIPKRGDILFMGWLWPITGIAGHVGIVDTADLYQFTLFNQNYPSYYPCNFRRFKYVYSGITIVRGWLSKQ